MVFPSMRVADRCAAELKQSGPEGSSFVQTVRFFLPLESIFVSGEEKWANFSLVVFPTEQWKQAMSVWRDTGAGISTRHADLCMENLNYLDSDSSWTSFQTPAPLKRDRRDSTHVEWLAPAQENFHQVQARVAELVTSENTNLKPVTAEDVFLFPTGMNAIFAASEALASLAPHSDVVAYG